MRLEQRAAVAFTLMSPLQRGATALTTVNYTRAAGA